MSCTGHMFCYLKHSNTLHAGSRNENNIKIMWTVNLSVVGISSPCREMYVNTWALLIPCVMSTLGKSRGLLTNSIFYTHRVVYMQ